MRGISLGLAVNYVVVYEKSETGWAAYVPDLPGVVTTGRTREDVRLLIQEAIEFHLDGLRKTDCRFLRRAPRLS
jgi:predicted RNase H-like HicB family nuclease